MAYHDHAESHYVPPPSYSGSYESQEYHERCSQSPIPIKGRQTASSATWSDLQSPLQQPIKNAIGNAFDRSETARIINQDLITQITAEVKKSVLDEIKSGVLASASTLQQSTSVSPTPHAPLSPASTAVSIPAREVYTPPSPREADFFGQSHPASDPLLRDPLLQGDDDTSSIPRYERAAPAEAIKERSVVRPNPVAPMSTDDFSPIERMWQPLFDSDGNALPRLGQFLRGLALHLIEDYEPQKSLVITPSKMLKFYEEVQLQGEMYPWQIIFGKLSYSSLSRIYRDMRCSHHLIQEHPAEQPYIPALTPRGFQDWMTAMILAYPESEYERISKAVLTMPISNADDRKERFPKEIPRRLFPSVENIQAQQRCAANLSAEGVGPLRRAPAFPPPPPTGRPPHRNMKGMSVNTQMDRERSLYGSKAYDCEDEVASASIPIERQRNPYSAAPGGGRSYGYDSNSLQRNRAHSDDTDESRPRTQSSASQRGPPPLDAYHQQSQHFRSSSTASGGRPRSRSFSKYGTSSDSAVSDIPRSYYPTNKYDSKDTNGRKHNASK